MPDGEIFIPPSRGPAPVHPYYWPARGRGRGGHRGRGGSRGRGSSRGRGASQPARPDAREPSPEQNESSRTNNNNPSSSRPRRSTAGKMPDRLDL